jgi:hypothetical protein
VVLLAPLADGLGPGPELGGLPAAAELLEELGVVLEAHHQVRMVRRQAVFEDRYGAPVERLGLGVPAGAW